MAENTMQPAVVAAQAVLEKLSKLSGEAFLTDFKIVCKSDEYAVHRVVLALHSPVLTASCTKAFMEEKERKIDLSDDDPVCVSTLVCFLYNLNYDTKSLPESTNPLTFHVDMCVIADKYGISTLQDLASMKFQNESQELKVTEEVLADAAARTYETPGPTKKMCDSIVKVALAQKLFMSKDEPTKESAFEQVMRTYPDLSADIAKAQQFTLQWTMADEEQKFECPSCGRTFIAYIPMAGHPSVSRFTCYWCKSSYEASTWKENIVEVWSVI